MTIEISCSNCGEEFRVRDEAAGKSFKCKLCGTTVRVPDDEDEPEDDEDDEAMFDTRPKRKKKRASTNSGRTLGPAIGLYVTGGLSLAFGILMMVAALTQDPELPPDEAGRVGYLVGYYGSAFGVPAIGVIVLIGAVCLQTYRVYPLAVVACVLSSIPCLSPCIVLGMPFGIWGLVLLLNDEVKDEFQ